MLHIVIRACTLDVNEEITMYSLGEGESDYIKKCKRTWEKLWKYFDVYKYKEECFKNTSIELNFQEKEFLINLIEDSTFLNIKREKLTNDEKDKVKETAKNFYGILERRIKITKEIQDKFLRITEEVSYIQEERFREIENNIRNLKKLVMTENYDDYCLNIKEKELWVDAFAKEMKDFLEEWEDIFLTMDSIKYDNDCYQESRNPEMLLDNALKQRKKVLVENNMK